MELLYVHIQKYRLFENQDFRFSDRFHIHFDSEKNLLDIQRNPDYFDLYPGNILGIGGIVGKNAAGKTTLLSLIGNPAAQRQLEEGNDPENPEQYFLIHFLGKDSDGEDLFLFETNHLSPYTPLFQSDPLSFPYAQWHMQDSASFVFRVRERRPVFCRTAEFLQEACLSDQLTAQSAILFFKGRWDAPVLSDDKDPFGRRVVPLSLDSQYEELRTLRDRIRNPLPGNPMFGNHHYSYRIQLTVPLNTVSGLPSLTGNAVFHIRNCVNQYEHTNRVPAILIFWLSLKFMIQKTERRIHAAMKAAGGKTADSEYLEELCRITASGDPTENLRCIYNSLMGHPWDFLPEPMANRDFFPAPPDLENNMTLMEALAKYSDYRCQILRTKVLCTLDFPITGKTDLSLLKQFFDQIGSNELYRPNLTMEISRLSSGELENLSMFASIHRELSGPSREKKHLILLFDEIERCMHPEMCRCLIRDLMDFLKGYPDQDFQILISSHSPFIVGDIPKEQLICLTADGKVQDSQPQSFGQNIHTLLKGPFYLEKTLSEYSVELMTRVAQCLSPMEETQPGLPPAASRWYSPAEIRSRLCEFLDSEHAGPGKRLPADDAETEAFLETVIRSVGEPLLRRSLQEKLDRWRRLGAGSIDREILRLEQQLALLRKEKDRLD